MKKIFTLIAAAFLGGVIVNAQTEADIPINNWTWGYNCTSSYADGILTGELTGDYGGVSTGWNDPQDWSAYNKLTVVIESYNNDWGKVYFQGSEGNIIAEETFTTINSTTKVEVSFDPTAEKIKDVKQLSVQGKGSGDIIKISRVYLTEATIIEDGTPIVLWEGEKNLASWDESLAISANKFAAAKEGKSPVLEITFTEDAVNATYWQLKTYANTDPWQVLTSNADELNTYECIELSSGATSYTVNLNDDDIALLKANGMRLQGWGVILNKVTLTNPGEVNAINVVEAADKYSANAPMYNLAGQQVTKSYKGVVIQNGKKFMNK